MLDWEGFKEILIYKMSKREYVWTLLGVIGFFVLVLGLLAAMIVVGIITHVSPFVWIFSDPQTIITFIILIFLFIYGVVWVIFAIKRITLYWVKPYVKPIHKTDNK